MPLFNEIAQVGLYPHMVYAVLFDAVNIDVKSEGEKYASGVISNTAAVLPPSAFRDCTTGRLSLP